MQKDNAANAFVVLKLLVWVYTSTQIGTLLLHSFDSLDVTRAQLFAVPTLIVPTLALDATFKYNTGVQMAIALILLVTCIDFSGALYAIILAAVDGADFPPFERGETLAFVLLNIFYLVRIVNAIAICTFLNKIRSSSFNERFALAKQA